MGRESVVSRIAHDFSDHSPRLVRGRGRWWDDLDPDFSEREEDFDLWLPDRVVVGAAAASDIALRTAGAALVGGLAVPIGYHPLKLLTLRREMALYKRLALRPVAEIHREPPRGTRLHLRRPSTAMFVPKDGSVRDLSFRSTFEPLNPKLKGEYARHSRNGWVHARHWQHDGGPRPTIIAVHGFSADLYFVNQVFFEIPWLYRLGCNVVLFTLPFHGRRQTRFSPFSGHGFFAGGLARVNEAFAHAMWDLRTLMSWLEDEHDVEQIGVTGISLGGLTAALLATVESRLAFAIPNVPVVSLADLVLEWQPLGALIRGMMRATGTSIHELRQSLGVSAPLTWEPAIDPERLMIVAGVGDRLAPPKHSRLLWDHWDRCRLHWFPGSHIVHLDKGAYLREIARFLAGIGFLPQR